MNRIRNFEDEEGEPGPPIVDGWDVIPPPAPPPVSLLRRVARLSGVYVLVVAALGLAVFVGSCAARFGWGGP